MFDLWNALLFDKGPLALSGSRAARFQYLKPVFQAVGRHEFEAAFLAGIAWTESDFIDTAVNTQSGASGLMQIMPFHFSALGWQAGDWSDPTKNIEAGLIILKQHGYGKQPLRAVLAGYGGFKTVDPAPYTKKVLTRASVLVPHFFS